MGDEEVAVFFYGLFMDVSLLESKGFIPSSSRIGCVHGYRMCIGQRATLVPDRTSRAYGVVMTLRPEDVAALYSGTSVADYVSESVTVVLADGTCEVAICYNLPEAALGSQASREYARSLLLLASKLGFPDDYLQQIRDAVDQSSGGRSCA